MSDVFATSGRCQFRSMKQFSKSCIEIGQKETKSSELSSVCHAKVNSALFCVQPKNSGRQVRPAGRKPLPVADKALVSNHSFRPQWFRGLSLDGHGKSEADHFLVGQNR